MIRSEKYISGGIYVSEKDLTATNPPEQGQSGADNHGAANQDGQTVQNSAGTVFAQDDAASGSGAKKKKKFNLKDRKTKKIIKRIIIWAVIIGLVVAVYFWFQSQAAKVANMMQTPISTAAAERGDLAVSITGSGVMEAMEQYDIVPMKQGKIMTAPFEEGDYVEKDSVLFTLDNSDALINIQKAQNSLAKADIANKSNQETMEDWVSTAPVAGYISDLNLKVGDTVNANTAVCTITNDDVITVKIPFSAAHIDSIYVGATAQLTSADYMTSNIYGTVSDIDRTPIRSSDGGVMYNVEITLDNPGAIAGGMSFTATINGILSAAAGTSEAADSEQLFTKASGKVVAVYHTNGDKVNAGDTIIEISNSATLDSIDQSNIEYDDLQLSLQSQYDELEDYTIKSPISGTVIKKEYKAGDTIGNSTQSVVLATIADMSKMKFTMDVDELDISKIQVGQTVDVVADALEDQVFVGTITQIIQEGESENGVTTYPVEVVIDTPGDLMIGMNVTATVVVESKSDVLKVPIEAVTKSGGKSYVQVLKADAAAQEDDAPSDAGAAPGGEQAVGYTMEDFEQREVQTGINSEDEIEIVSGLSEGELVYIATATTDDSAMQMMMMGGGMGGSAGGGGGAPSDGGGAPPEGGGPSGGGPQ